MSTAHLLLTRFNVRRGPETDARALSLEWLNHRLALFAGVTVPSVLAQTRRPDQWLIFLDEQTPPEFRTALDRCLACLPWVRQVYCVALDTAALTETIAPCLPSQADWLLTTRLDNDDALHPEFIATVQAMVSPGHREFLNPRHGLIVTDGRLYRKQDLSSPFITLSEPVAGFRTVWLDQHQRLANHGPIRQFGLKDAWVQVVHGGNLANQVRGLRVHGRSVLHGVLPLSLAREVRPLAMPAWIADNTIGLVKRYAGSGWRRLLRELADLRVRT